MEDKSIQNITTQAFKSYGIVIDHAVTHTDHFFKVLISEKNAGWRIAFFEINRKSTNMFENHPFSCESFEPVSGTTLLFVAKNETPEDFEIFLLDKPVCLSKGIWHQVITLCEYSQIKITENDEVESEFYYFKETMHPVVKSLIK